MEKEEKVVITLEELEAEAARLVATLTPQAEAATLIALSGELGAGKTTFVQAIARALGVADIVTSPTFVLEKIYTLPQSEFLSPRFERLIHIDAYRLEEGAELAPLGFDELMKDSSNLVLLEWPERVTGVLPPPTAHITFAIHSDGSRTLFYA